jgi:ribose 5-phosphate isomerase B
MNVICLGARVLGPSLAGELIKAFLNARFSGADRHRRRLSKVKKLEEAGGKG